MAPDWPWPDSLDALVVAPGQHRLVFENAHVRVLDTRIAPGEWTPVHTHRWPVSHYVVSWSDFVRRDAEGAVLVDRQADLGTPRRLCGATRWRHTRRRTWERSRCTSSALK